MTANTTSNRSKSEVQLPQELEQLDSEIDREEGRVARLQELSDQIESVYEEADKLDQEGREIVAEGIPKVRHELGGARTIDELEQITENIVDIVAAPHREAVQKAREEVCETLGLTGELSEETLNELNTDLEDRPTEQLRSDRSTLEAVESNLTGLNDTATQVIAERVQNAPVKTLTSPSFEPFVDQHSEQYAALETLDDKLHAFTWWPDLSLAETKSLYPEDGNNINVGEVEEFVENIESVVETMPEALPLESVIQNRLTSTIPEADSETLRQEFETISQRVTDSTDYKKEITLALQLTDDLEDGADRARSVHHCVEQLRLAPDDDESDDPVNSLIKMAEELSEAYREWADSFHEVLQQDAVAIEAIESHLDNAPKFQPNQDRAVAVIGHSAVEEVIENPQAAVRAHEAYQEWVEELKEEKDSEDGQTNVDLLIDLVRGKRISSENIDASDFEVLADLLGNGLKVRYAGAKPTEAR